MDAIAGLDFGNSYTLHHQSNDLLYGFIDKISVREEGHILLISRLPQRRLLEHFDLNRVESYWITTQEVAGSIQPSIEQLMDLINSRIENHNGVAIIEGIEWLISLYGFADVLNLVMKIKDNLHRKPWSILFVVTEGVFSEIEYAKWHRESPLWSIPVAELVEVVLEETVPELYDVGVQVEPNDVEKKTGLSFLVRIPREGFNKDIARRRILQWRRMGLDVSESEPILFQSSDDKAYELYKSVEDKVRKAVELDNRLDILEQRGFKSEVTKMRFRVRQLTGFDDVESRINELI